MRRIVNGTLFNSLHFVRFIVLKAKESMVSLALLGNGLSFLKTSGNVHRRQKPRFFPVHFIDVMHNFGLFFDHVLCLLPNVLVSK